MGLIVYPPNNHQTDSKSIFFIGSATESCIINDQKIELVYAGNFCPVFDLNVGENVFKIELDGESFNYQITRTESQCSMLKAQCIPVEHSALNVQRLALSVERICIDPGHGGSARGTCSPKGIAEKDLNLSLAKVIKAEFDDRGITAILTRTSDIDLGLADRVKIAQEQDCSLFISIHYNAVPDNEIPLEHRGISVHYYYDENIALAEKFLQALVETTGLASAGIVKQNLHVLRENTVMPALLIEFGYLIHPIESEVICTEAFQKAAANAIAKICRKA